MKRKPKKLRYEAQGASWEKEGLFAEADWRYELLIDYLKLSQHYRLVCNWSRGGNTGRPNGAPSDWKRLVATYKDFGDVFRIPESKWWEKRGKGLFGIRAAKTEAFAIPLSAQGRRPVDADSLRVLETRWREMAQPDLLLVAIPRNQTKQAALRQVNKIVRAENFAASTPASVKPRYSLTKSKLQEATIKEGVMALKLYRLNVPLWEIGNRLELTVDTVSEDEIRAPDQVVADKKRYLQTLASKLVRKAILIAENAARGHFPSDAPIAALSQSVTKGRKAGRPKRQ